MKIIINRDNILNGILLIFSVFPIISEKIKGLPVVLLLIGSLFLYKKSSINWKWLLINSSLFIIYLLSVIYSDNYSDAFKRLETGLSILIIPICFFFFLSNFKIKSFIKLTFIKGFIISTALFSILSGIVIFLNDSKENYLWNTDRYRDVITNMPLIGEHPIYASIFISIAVIFFIHIIKNNLINKLSTKLFFALITLINLTMLIVLLSKGAIIALCIAIFFYFIMSKTRIFYKTFIGGCIIITLIMLFIFNRRMNELITMQTYAEFNPNLSTSMRLGIYDCSFEIIKKNWITGYGIGDAQEALNLCYANKSDILLMHKFNSHNQYLDVIIKTGIFGLLIFLAFLFLNLKEALKKRSILVTVIIVFYGVIFLTENVLSRQSGVIMFFFLISFFNNSNTDLSNDNYDSKPFII